MDSTCDRQMMPGGFEVPTPNIQDPLTGPHQELQGSSTHSSRPGVGYHKTPSEFCLWSHWQASKDTPAHQALRCHVDLTLGHPSEHSQLEALSMSSEQPMDRIDQLHRDNNDTPPADVWRRFITRGHTGVTTIRVDDDDTLLLLFPNSTTLI